MMLEASTLLEQASASFVAPDHFQEDLGRVSRLIAARAEMGSAFAFYGAYPEEPSEEREKGAAPSAPLSLEHEGGFAAEAFLPSAYRAPQILGDTPPSRKRTDPKTVTFLRDL